MSVKKKYQVLSMILASMVGCAFLTSCARSPAIQYYALAAHHTSSSLTPAMDRPWRCASTFLEPVYIPEYLARLQVVERISEHQLAIRNHRRWAEPLADGIRRVLAENLSILLKDDQLLYASGQQAATAECRLSVSLLRFEVGPDQTAELLARWTIENKTGSLALNEPVHRYQSATAEGFEDQVSELSNLLWHLAQDLANSLTEKDSIPR